MKVLTVYAHHDPRSFCHGVLERFTDGLRDAGHTTEVIDLYAINFDPVFRERDVASYTAADTPEDILALQDPRGRIMNSRHGPFQRWLAARALRGKSQSDIAAEIRSHMPKDVLAQQEKVAWADGLAFIAPIHFCSFPAILKGWIDRVWTPDFAFGLTSAGWHGDINGRIPLLHHRRALIMSTSTSTGRRPLRLSWSGDTSSRLTSSAAASRDPRWTPGNPRPPDHPWLTRTR